MPIVPAVTPLTASSVDILNAIRNSATQNYQHYVPVAKADAQSVRAIGAIIMDSVPLQNEFLSALVNRIGRVIITSKMYSNPLALFKKGILDFGETVEEIFVNIAKPFQFDPAVAETTIFKREIPDVRAAFHPMNYQKFYKATVSHDQLRQAFLSWEGVTDLINKIVESLYTGAEYDEFQTMKYLLARHLLNGHLYPVTVPVANADNAKTIVSNVKAFSNELEFMSSDYNLAGVSTHTKKDAQYMLINAPFDAVMDVEVLASAFNMDKAEFLGHRVMVDGFGKLDTARLAILFAGDPTYVAITDAEKAALNAIPAVIVDRDWFMIFDNFVNFTEQYNGQGLYWNYWYHTWKTFSTSPFANCGAFVVGVPSVVSVTVSPETASAAAGQTVNLSATVTVANFAPKAVNWYINSELSTIDNSGNLHIGAEETAGTITVTVKSAFDVTKTDTAIITVL